jgi:hypothetical protein
MAGAAFTLPTDVHIFTIPASLALDGAEQAVVITMAAGTFPPRRIQLSCDTGFYLGRVSGDIAAGRKAWIPAVVELLVHGATTVTLYVLGTNGKTLTFLVLEGQQ